MDTPRVDNADLDKWRDLWEADRPIQTEPEGGISGRIKRFVRRFVTAPQQDLWERQRLYNMLIQHHLEARLDEEQKDPVGVVARDLESLQDDLLQYLRNLDDKYEGEIQSTKQEFLNYLEVHEKRILRLEEIENQGLEQIERHHEAAFALIDQKLDQYRQQALDLRAQLVSLLKVAQSGGKEALQVAVEEQGYVELERRHRGTEEEIVHRIEPYLPFFKSKGEILDLGCGRGEALELLTEREFTCRGVDSNGEMVAHCRDKGLKVVQGDLFDVLAAAPEESLGGVVSFHVIEHLPAPALERLIALSWRALESGGVIVLETPSPLSLVVGASNFWLDPTHQRPVHPDSLRLMLELVGFESVERIDRQPFAEADRLGEIPTAELSDDMQWMAHQVNQLRDQLDTLIYGFQDYGMVGRKP